MLILEESNLNKVKPINQEQYTCSCGCTGQENDIFEKIEQHTNESNK
ncbi:MAG: hypothetical protein ACFFD7_02380 [Candidatus Thorarchaeota archaeon]